MSAPSNAIYVNGGPPVSGDGLNTFIQTTTNVSTLRTFIGISGMEVSILGTTSPGDGGQGTFYWNINNVAPDNNGVTTVIPTGSGSGAWVRLTASGGGGGGGTETGEVISAGGTYNLASVTEGSPFNYVVTTTAAVIINIPASNASTPWGRVNISAYTAAPNITVMSSSLINGETNTTITGYYESEDFLDFGAGWQIQ